MTLFLLGFVCGFAPLAVIGLVNETRVYRRMLAGPKARPESLR